MEQISTLDKIKENFQKNAYDVLKNHYADFKGRAGRANFWYFQLYMLILFFVCNTLFEIMGIGNLSKLIFLFLFLPILSISVRRLHDTGKSWYWLLLLGIGPSLLILIAILLAGSTLLGLFFIAFPSFTLVFQYLLLGFQCLQIASNIWLLVLFCQKGEAKENAWGSAQ